MSRPQDTLADVLLGDLGVCDDVNEVREVPILQPGFEGMLGYDFNRRLWWWFIDCFVEDLEERGRLHAMADEIRRVFLDLAKLHKAETGDPCRLPEKLIRCLEQRVIAKAAPSAYEIATGAKRHQVGRASANIRRLTAEEAWRIAS